MADIRGLREKIMDRNVSYIFKQSNEPNPIDKKLLNYGPKLSKKCDEDSTYS